MSPRSLVSPLGLLLGLSLVAAPPEFVKERVPDSGLQPRVAVDPDGNTHLVYLRGDPKAADVVVRHRGPAATSWSEPVVVNSQPGSAIAVGTVRGAQVAVGRGGRLHFVWNGSGTARPKPRVGVPLLYATLAPDARAASAQRCLSGETRHLDGGAAVAADPAGHVFVVWHAAPPDQDGEDHRRVHVARSDDDGQHFGPPVAVPVASDGVCGCCGLQAAAVGDALLVSYRRAVRGDDRGMTLLVSRDRGETWTRTPLDDWKANQCPMSTAAILPAEGGAWLGWESAGHVRIARWNPVGGLEPMQDLGGGGRKHPALAVDGAGEPVAAWTVGTGWERGGSAAWSAFRGSRAEASAPGVPAWGTVAVYRAADGMHVLY
jgi:hypothetical protein